MRDSHTFTMALLTARNALRPFFPGLTWRHVRAGIRWAVAQDIDKLNAPPVAEPGKLLTIEEAGARLALKRRSMEYLIAEGKLRAIKLGKRSVRIPETEVTAYAIGRPAPGSDALWGQLGFGTNVADAGVCAVTAAPCGSKATGLEEPAATQATIEGEA